MAGALGALALGCSHPSPAPAPVTPAIVVPVPADTAAKAAAQTADDSAADEATLQALASLDSSKTPPDRERGTVPRVSLPPAAVSTEAEKLFPATTGGTAATASPTFDLDVESFASNNRVQYYLDFFLGKARDRFEIWIGRLNRYEGMIR